MFYGQQKSRILKAATAPDAVSGPGPRRAGLCEGCAAPCASPLPLDQDLPAIPTDVAPAPRLQTAKKGQPNAFVVSVSACGEPSHFLVGTLKRREVAVAVRYHLDAAVLHPPPGTRPGREGLLGHERRRRRRAPPPRVARLH